MELNNHENMCGICNQSFDELHPSHSVNCSQSSHLYHINCLKRWYDSWYDELCISLREMPDKDNIVVNKSVCPLCSDNKNTLYITVYNNYRSILNKFYFEDTIQTESKTHTYRLNTILQEEGGELLSNFQLFKKARENKSLLYGYKIVEYKCNPSQTHYVFYTNIKMFKKCESFIFKENSFTDTYINDAGDFALPATINNIIENSSNKDMYNIISVNKLYNVYNLYLEYSELLTKLINVIILVVILAVIIM